jgi:hypothetical protein
MRLASVTKVKKGSVKPRDALVVLKADHDSIAGLFRDYDKLGPSASARERGKRGLRICHLIAIHSAVEEEIFYPAVAAVLGAKAASLLAEAAIEHEVIDKLVGQLENIPARDKNFDATIKVLARYVKHHVEMEEGRIFPLVRRARFDIAGTGERLVSRQLDLATQPLRKCLFREGRTVMAQSA